MPDSIPITIFWFSLAVVFFTFLGYPLVICLLARLREPTQPAPTPSTSMSVTVVLAAHNEATRITSRLQNLLATDYPADKMKIIVVSDGSTDGTVAQIKSHPDPRIQLLVQPQRLGKAVALNTALAAANSELIVFTDVRQTFARDAITKLARHFVDPQIGAVSGELMIDSATSSVGGGVDAYWHLEKIIRNAEARWDSSIGCTGAIYAIRRMLYQPIPNDTILDDVVIPMQITQQGFRVGFDSEAHAFDPQTLEPDREYRRKRRTLAGNYQMLFRYSGWLLPGQNRLWWQLISHKYLRLAAPFFLGLLLLSNSLLLTIDFYKALFVGQCIFYLLAICGLAFRTKKIKLFSLPAGFTFLNWMSLAGLWHYCSHRNQSAWELNRPHLSPNV